MESRAINELKRMKSELESDVADMIGARLERFMHESGLAVDQINVRLIDVSHIGSNRQIIVSGVSTTLVSEGLRIE